jgi:hypothetical protein
LHPKLGLPVGQIERLMPRLLIFLIGLIERSST